MDKYLLEILKNVNTIIIPGLGALTITNHDTGEIMFMSYLKHDDGKLTQYIVENEGFEELEAKNLIAKYVREIQLTVDKGESYDMFQFGSFVKDGDDIDFKNWEGDKAISQDATIEEKEVITEPVTEEPAVVEPTPVIETVEEKEIKEVTPPIIEEKAEPVVLQLKEDEPKKELNILEKEERAATAEKLDKLRKNKESKPAKKKKGVGFWMLMTLIVLILAGGTYFGMNYDRLKQHVPFLADKKEVKKEPVVNENETSDNSSEEDKSTEEPEVEEEIIPEPIEPEVNEKPTSNFSNNGDLPFHIIAGAFGSEANANRLGEKLKSEGYNVKVGPGRGMTLVSIKSFSTREEAQKGLNELQTVAPNGWVYEWK